MKRQATPHTQRTPPSPTPPHPTPSALTKKLFLRSQIFKTVDSGCKDSNDLTCDFRGKKVAFDKTSHPSRTNPPHPTLPHLAPPRPTLLTFPTHPLGLVATVETGVAPGQVSGVGPCLPFPPSPPFQKPFKTFQKPFKNLSKPFIHFSKPFNKLINKQFKNFQKLSKPSKTFQNLSTTFQKHFRTFQKPFKNLSKSFRNLPKTFQNLSKTFPKPFKTFQKLSKPFRTFSRTFQKPFRNPSKSVSKAVQRIVCLSRQPFCAPRKKTLAPPIE